MSKTHLAEVEPRAPADEAQDRKEQPRVPAEGALEALAPGRGETVVGEPPRLRLLPEQDDGEMDHLDDEEGQEPAGHHHDPGDDAHSSLPVPRISL